MLPLDAVTAADVDVTEAVVVTSLTADGSPLPAAVTAVTAGRFANSPVPVLSATHHRHSSMLLNMPSHWP